MFFYNKHKIIMSTLLELQQKVIDLKQSVDSEKSSHSLEVAALKENIKELTDKIATGVITSDEVSDVVKNLDDIKNEVEAPEPVVAG